MAGAEAHHLRTVLRLGAGADIELFDGSGGVYQARITHIGKEIELTITSQTTFAASPPLLAIAQGLLKGKKMDLLVQKANELGVTSFLPFHSDHCVAPSPKDAKLLRWDKILLESCKQCGRPIPLQVAELLSFDSVLARGGKYETKIIFWERETQNRLRDFQVVAAAGSILALIGPEGGFSIEEIDRATRAGFTPVSLGRLTLRAETATLAAMSVLQYLGGNL